MSGADGTDRGGGQAGETTAVPWSSATLLAATCGWVGRAGIAPGTFGSLVGVLLALATGAVATWAQDAGAGRGTIAAIEAVLVAAVCLAGVPICSRAAVLLGRGKDPGAVVYDEMAALPLVLLPLAPSERSPLWLAAAFVLFRIFDIAKPFPCRLLERLPAGWGIMADDWAAAAWAAGALALACRWM